MRVVPSDKPQKIELDLQPNGFRQYLFVNRFRVVWLEGEHAFVEFGLVVEGRLVQGYACVLDKDVLDNSRDSLLRYYGRMPEPEGAEMPASFALPAGCPVEAPLVMNMGHSAAVAEISFCSVATGLLVRAIKGGKSKVEADQLSVLRCDVALQRRLIEELYVEGACDAN